MQVISLLQIQSDQELEHLPDRICTRSVNKGIAKTEVHVNSIFEKLTDL